MCDPSTRSRSSFDRSCGHHPSTRSRSVIIRRHVIIIRLRHDPSLDHRGITPTQSHFYSISNRGCGDNPSISSSSLLTPDHRGHPSTQSRLGVIRPLYFDQRSSVHSTLIRGHSSNQSRLGVIHQLYFDQRSSVHSVAVRCHPSTRFRSEVIH